MQMNQFDEKAQTGLRILMENFWVLRDKEPAVYQLIREREKTIKRYVDDKFGFDLIVHQHFIKLEKIPVETKNWMGIQDFQEPRDYAIFCCALAFTEDRSVDDQFLLSDICEEIKDIYPGDFPLDWTNYNHRRSLVRVIKQLEKQSILLPVEGEIDQFAMHEDQEVLYETTIYARYFMRSYPKDLFAFDSIEAILTSEWERHEADERRKRVYRKLFFSPAVYRESEEDLDFAYIRNYRNRLREDIEEHTLFRLEIFKNAALLVADERKQQLTLFPDQKSIMDVALHLFAYLREHIDTYAPNEFGNIRLTAVMFEQLIKDVSTIYSRGWTKYYREASTTTIMSELAATLHSWEMLDIEEGTNAYILRPLVGRSYGKYPQRFLAEEETSNDQAT